MKKPFVIIFLVFGASIYGYVPAGIGTASLNSAFAWYKNPKVINPIL